MTRKIPRAPKRAAGFIRQYAPEPADAWQRWDEAFAEPLHPAPQLARRLAGAGNIATIEAPVSGTDAELAELFSVARGAFETLLRACETGAAGASRAESVRKALQSKKATELAAALRQDRPGHAN